MTDIHIKLLSENKKLCDAVFMHDKLVEYGVSMTDIHIKLLSENKKLCDAVFNS